MTTVITADNGGVSGTAGLKQSADSSGVLALATGTGTTAVTIDASQNVGIGTSSPLTSFYQLTVNGTGGGIALKGGASDINRLGFTVDGGDGNTGIIRYNHSDNSMQFWTANGTSNGERARIDSSGNFGIAQTPAANGGPLQVTYNSSTNACVRLSTNNSSTAGELINFIKSTGTATGAITFGASQNTIVYGGTSDYRLKENIAPMIGALSTVAALKPCTYTWKSDGSDGQGFIAHELAEVVPDAVVGEKDAVDADGNPKYQNIDTSFLVATLTAAIQEQQALITQLQADVAALKGTK
jgi:hypothetical protein